LILVTEKMPTKLSISLAKDIQKALLDGDPTIAESLAKDALASGVPALSIVEDGFVPGLKRMGELFETGEVFLPELMLAGEAMKSAMKVLGPALKAAGGKQAARPVIVLGTVEGDIHEIGKNIVGILLETSGYEVIDLGMEVKADTFVKAAKDHSAKIIGASALLTTTMEHQREVVQKVRSEKLDIKVIVGGSPVTQEWANEIGADGYAQDAPDAVRLVEHILHGRTP
jgi:5-methyltetrahydrofolate--homocysteine methyltransferase